MVNSIKQILVLTVFTLFISLVSAEPSILINGNIYERIDEIKTGYEQQAEYPSDNNAISIDIFGTTGNWEIQIKLDENTWHNNLRIFAKRNSKGKGLDCIKGGNNYQELTNTYQRFFTGNGDRSRINIQIMLVGISIHVPPKNYSCNIEFKIVPVDVVHDIDRDIVFPFEKDLFFSTKDNFHKIINDKDIIQDKTVIDNIQKSKTIPVQKKQHTEF